jgi:hypothetical protein
MSPLSKAEISAFPVGPVDQEAGLGLGDDERARCAAQRRLSEVIAERRTVASAAGSWRSACGTFIGYAAAGGRRRFGLNAQGAWTAVQQPHRRDIADFGLTLVTEMLAQHHALMVSHETLRKWMIETGIRLSRKQRRCFHQPRLRREAFGELIQIDGSEHRWFEDRSAIVNGSLNLTHLGIEPATWN